MDEIKNLPNGDHITSADGNVVIERFYRYYTISVPKSKKLGGQYYENEDLLDLVDGRNFYPSRGTLKGDIAAEDIEKVVKVLSGLGVQLKSDSQVQFKSDIETGKTMTDERFNNSQISLSHRTETNDSAKKGLTLSQRQEKSYTDEKGNYHKGLEEELAELEDRITRTGEEGVGDSEQGDESSAGVQSSRPDTGSLNDLRREAAEIRAEISRRQQKKQELSSKYDIDEKGNISLDNLSRMFHDLNSNKIIGKLFDKVFAVLKDLGVDFRFTNYLDANVGGEAVAFGNVTFYNWDAQLRDIGDQEKARILLHEMIHNVASQILKRYEHPELGELTARQKKLAKKINDIYDTVKSYVLVNNDGAELYGIRHDAHEMLSELANPDFRDMLDSIP